MKIAIISFCALAIAAAAAFIPRQQTATTTVKDSPSPSAFKPVAIIELFTSQGCSSCPSADRLLSGTIKAAKSSGANVFALSFHVDYWNRLGWADPFSTRAYSMRQQNYASQMEQGSVYTPQMIVNGSREFVGSDEAKLKDALGSALKAAPVAAFKALSATVVTGAAPKVTYTLDGNYDGCKVNFALVSLSETTSIKRGENGGLTLISENVVRQFLSVPAVTGGEISFDASPVPTGNNVAIIAYIQRSGDMKILGGASATIN